MRYRIDTKHPAVKDVLEDSGDHEPLIRAMLRVIEETIPVQRIWLDTAESRETPRIEFAEEPEEEIMTILTVMYKNMIIHKGFTPSAARDRLLKIEPFNKHSSLVNRLTNIIIDHEGKK